ncbi:MAG: hypothetical protein AAF802_08355 [Planctomycetota bacterium]
MRRLFRSAIGATGLWAFAALFGFATLSPQPVAAEPAKSQIASPTHRQIRILRPKLDGDAIQLHTLKTNRDGHLLLAVSKLDTDAEKAGPYGLAVPTDGYVLKIDAEGNELGRWKCGFTPSAIAVTPDGDVFVGGGGKVAKLTDDGHTSEPIDSPHIGDRKTFAKRTVEAQQRMMRSFMTEESLEPLRDMVKQLEEVEEDDRTRVQEAQLKALKDQLEQMESMIASSDEEEDAEEEEEFQLDPAMEASVRYAMAVTSMAASNDKVFVCASDPAKGGYAIWSLDHDLNTDSIEQVMTDLRGCCGQMDIQCCDDQLVISENGSFRVGFYDQSGERTAQFGKMDRSSEEGFGSCCNPMNSMPLPDGTVLTAESSIGHIKHFTADGTLIAYIGKAQIGGGCKHCAIGHDPENDLYFMMYQDKNAVCVLGNSEEYPISEAELAIANRQADFVRLYAGTWTKEGTKVPESSGGGFFGALFGGGDDEEEVTAVIDNSNPITSWTIDETGDLKVNAGQYASFMTDAKLELLPNDEGDEDGLFRVAVTDNQVRMLEGSLSVKGDEMTLALDQGSEVILIRKTKPKTEACEEDCEEGCDEESCEEDADCAKSEGSPGETDMLANFDAVEDEVVVMVEVEEEEAVQEEVALEGVFDSSIMQPRFDYKLVAPADLKTKAEAKLNQLGEDGWEFCGKLNGKLMFKRMNLSELQGALGVSK